MPPADDAQKQPRRRPLLSYECHNGEHGNKCSRNPKGVMGSLNYAVCDCPCHKQKKGQNDADA